MPVTTSRLASSPLRWLLLAFAILAALYAWATPIFEASDELWHFGLVAHLAKTGELPVQDPAVITPWRQEGSQPPLYYALAALIARPFDLSDMDDQRQPNPHAKAGVPLAADNKNLVLHAAPHPPLRGTAAAVYAVRAFSILLGVVTVAAVYASARVLLPERPAVALLAAGLTAFNPMFLFITASVNNDNLVTALNSVIIWQALLMIRKNKLTLRRSLLISGLLALAALSKLSGLVLIPAVALAGLWIAWRARDWRGLLTLAALMIGAWGLLAGWWYWRNIQLYGELFGTARMVAVAGPRLEPFTPGTLLAEFQGFRISFWGLFGGVNVLAPEAFYILMDAVTALALIGLGRYAWRRRGDWPALIPLAFLGVIIAGGMLGVIQWTAQTYASQGRLLFPFMAAISPLLALGLRSLPVRGWRLPARPAVIGLAALAALMPFIAIAPAYAPVPVVDGLPAEASPVYAQFGEAVTLIGYRAEPRRYEPGERVPVTLYWQAAAQTGRDLSLYVHAVLDDGTVIGKVDTYPGGGRLRTSTWQPGAIYADTYAVPIDADATGRSALRISVGWWHYPTETLIPAVDAEGNPLESVMLGAGGFVAPGAAFDPPDDLTPAEAAFGGVIALEGYRLEEDTLTLLWRATGTPRAAYTVFVQVVDAAGAIAGQGDAPPELPTAFWRRGERYTTTHTLHYPETPAPGEYTVLVGWYAPEDFARLETPRDDNAHPLLTLTRP